MATPEEEHALLARYQAAEGDVAREAAAACLARLYFDAASALSGGGHYSEWLDFLTRGNNWHFTASNHRCDYLAKTLRNPWTHPLSAPKDAALRYMWAYRHWQRNDASTTSGGMYTPDGLAVELRGGMIHVTKFNGQPCTERFSARAIYDELHATKRDGPRQLSLFAEAV